MKKTITVNWRDFVEADDGNTSFYGGSITITVARRHPWTTWVRAAWENLKNKWHPKCRTRLPWWPPRFKTETFEFLCSGSDRSGLDATYHGDYKGIATWELDDFMHEEVTTWREGTEFELVIKGRSLYS